MVEPMHQGEGSGMVECAARLAIAASGIRIAANLQLENSYWLPASRVLAVPPFLPESEWERLADRLLAPSIPQPRAAE